MANKNVDAFVEKYTPVAQQVGKEIGVDPNVLLSQWALETGWGKNIIPGTNNLGNIKDFSGHGKEATDSHTGSKDKYVKFEDPEVFGMYYADMIKRQFPHAVNTGTDIGAFTRGLVSGKSGSYFEAKPDDYAKRMTTLHNMIPGTESLPEPVGVSAPAPAPSEETDAQRDARIQADMDAQEKRQAQLIGGGVGVGVSATRAAGSGAGAALEAGARRVGAGFRTGMQGGLPGSASGAPAGVPGAPGAPGAAGLPGAPGAAPQGGLSIMRQTPPMGAADAGRMASGQTGAMTYNYGKAAGLTDIEAARALDMTKQAGGVHDLSTIRREGTQRVQQLFPTETWRENPRFGGLLTPDQGAGGGPRASYTVQGPVRDVPPGTLMGPSAPPPEGTLRQLPPRTPIPTAPAQPSGLQQVTNMFRGMMRPVAATAQAVGRYIMPPLAMASAAGEGVNIAQQLRKPEEQRDLTGMALSAGNILGSGLSMFPATAPVGIPLMLGTGAAQAYRSSPEAQQFIKKKLEAAGEMPYSDPMTGYAP